MLGEHPQNCVKWGPAWQSFEKQARSGSRRDVCLCVCVCVTGASAAAACIHDSECLGFFGLA